MQRGLCKIWVGVCIWLSGRWTPQVSKCSAASEASPGYPRFQVTGMIEGYFWFEVFDFGIFLGWKILASVWFKKKFFGVFKTIWRFLIVPMYPSYIVPRINFYDLEIQHGIFLRLNFGPRNFWGFVWSPRDLFGFWFLSPFDHPCHLKSGVIPPGKLVCDKRRLQTGR